MGPGKLAIALFPGLIEFVTERLDVVRMLRQILQYLNCGSRNRGDPTERGN